MGNFGLALCPQERGASVNKGLLCQKGLIMFHLNLIVRGVQVREPFAEFIRTALEPETLLITCGLPATWKTETSEEVSKIKGYPILRSDLIRLEVLKNEDVFDPKVAGNMSKRLSVYDEMFRRAEELAGELKGVILDATFVTQELRRRAAGIAAKHGLTFVILETSCPQEVSVERIKRRTKEKYESNALTVEAYLANKNKFEPVDLDDLKKRHPKLKITQLTVDTCHDSPEDWYVIGMEKR
jgi:predicted kinase